MKIDRFLHLIPEIEKAVADLRPDAIVFGLGATGWLLPWIDQSLLAGVRTWTCHDGCRIFPADDLLLMDGSVNGLNPCTDRFEHICNSRPKRWWAIPSAWKHWQKHLPEAVRPLVRLQDFTVWNPHSPPGTIKFKFNRHRAEFQPNAQGVMEKVRTDDIIPDTVAISPTGMTTLAWKEGCRRIGIIGVDMLPDHGHTSRSYHKQIDYFFCSAAAAAHAQGGAVVNLSPITALQGFKKWKPSESSSAPTSGSAQPEPNKPSNTASESEPVAQ